MSNLINYIYKTQDEEFRKAMEAACEAARSDFLAYCMLVNPNFVVGPHHRLIADKLNALFRGEIKRLMIFMPPRSGKSLMASVLFPSYVMGMNPRWQIIGASHSAELAQDFSREVRNLVMVDEFKACFNDVTLRADSRAANRWHTNCGGVYTAVGTGGKIAGRGANLATIDDPISEQDAWSKTKRETVNKWYPSGLRSRLMPNGRVCLVMTRWHETDLAGSLLKYSEINEDADQWEVLTIPAILDEESAILLAGARLKCIEQGLLPKSYPEMEVGKTYWPRLEEYAELDQGLSGWPTDELLKTKANTPSHEWEALYMQRPTAEEGNILKRRYWRCWEKSSPPKCDYVLMSLDTAYSKEDSADYSAITTWGIFRDGQKKPNMVMLGAQKGRWEFPELRRKVFDLYNFHRPDAVLIEKKASGQSLLQELRASGVPVLEYNPDKDKIARAYACTPIFHGGKVWFPANKNWADDVMYECSVFPAGEHDDYVDTVTQAVLWMKNGSWIIHPDDEWMYPEEYDTIKKRRYY